MSKNKDYFPHDVEAIQDLKIIAAIEEYGPAGYAFFWRIIELLHEAEDHKLEHKKYVVLAIAKQLNANAEQIEAFINSAINDYDLFKSDGRFFWNDRVLRNIERRKEVSLKRSESGRLGGLKKQSKAIDKQDLAKLKLKDNTNVLSKVKNINIVFDVFWDLYGKKKDKERSEKKWEKLTDEERSLALEDIPKYRASVNDHQYLKDPLTYLNGKCWLDERSDILTKSAASKPYNSSNVPERGKFIA